MSATMDILIANLVNASRAAGFCRGKRIDDTADNRAEDAALDALKAEIKRPLALLKEIDADWPVATSELRERVRKEIQACEA